MFYNNTFYFFQDTSIVRVVALASTKIHGPTTVVYSGSILPLMFIGRDQWSNHVDMINPESVFPWGVSAAELSLKATWSVDGDGAEIVTSNTDYVSGAVYLRCKKAGVVQVRAVVEQPNSDLAKVQFLGSHRQRSILNASITVTIVDQIQINGRSPLRMLMSPSSVLALKSSE